MFLNCSKLVFVIGGLGASVELILQFVQRLSGMDFKIGAQKDAYLCQQPRFAVRNKRYASNVEQAVVHVL